MFSMAWRMLKLGRMKALIQGFLPCLNQHSERSHFHDLIREGHSGFLRNQLSGHESPGTGRAGGIAVGSRMPDACGVPEDPATMAN
jgi:hypothetical protein